MGKMAWSTAEEQIARHLGGVLLTEAEKESLWRSLQPVAITAGDKSYYSCCRQYGPACRARHRETGKCPVCGRMVLNIQRRWIKRDERMEQFHYLYRKSLTDENTIIVIGVWVAEIWEKAKLCPPESVETYIKPNGLVVIPYGGSPERYIWEDYYYGGSCWQRRTKPWGSLKIAWKTQAAPIQTVVHERELRRSVEGTRFAKMMAWAADARGVWLEKNMINTLVNIAKYPQMEYLLARGLERPVKDRLNMAGYKTVNWQAKTAEKMLPLTRDELGRIKARKLDITEETLLMMKTARENGQKVKLEDVMEVTRGMSWYEAAELAKLWKIYGRPYGYGLMQMLRYVKRKSGNGHGFTRLWHDYLRELRELGEIEDAARVFPAELHEAHAETSARVQVKASEDRQEKLERQLEELRKKYSFRACGLVLEPFGTLEEVIAEGSRQHICIGSYAERYANGGTVLCKLRRESDPGTPWHAVEFTTRGQMVQCRGAYNTTEPQDEKAVRDFWAAWDEAHKTKTDVHITIKARRQAA